MAKADITVGVNTKFNGEGLKKLDAGMKDAARGARTASQALGSISSELGQVGGAAGKAAQALSGMMSAITAGGPIAIAIAAITTAIGFVIKAFNDAKEAAREAAKTISDSFGQSLDGITSRLRGIEQFWDKVRKIVSKDSANTQTVNDLTTRQGKAESELVYIQQRANMTSDYDKARNKAKQSYDLAMWETNDKITRSQKNVQDAGNEIDMLDEEISDLKKEIGKMEQESIKQYALTVDSGIKGQYEKLQKELEDAKNAAFSKGKDTVAFMEGDTGFGPNRMGQRQAVTYGEAMERAAKALDEFKKDNEDAIGQIDKYNQNLKKYNEETAKLAEKESSRQGLITKLELAQHEEEVVITEVTAERARLEEAYKEQVTNIARQERAEKLANQKKEKEEEDRRKAEEERKAKAKKRAEIEDKIEKKQGEREKTLEEANAKEKALTEQEKKLAEELKKAQDAAKGMKAGFDAAAEIANAMGKDNPWQGAQNAQGGVNQWIGANNRAANEAKKEAGRIGANIRGAEGQQGQLANRVFDKNGNIRKTANIMDIGRFADVSDFLGGKGVSKEQREGLQAQADELRKRLFDENGNLKKSVNPRSRDVQQLEKIEGLLGKFKKLDDVKKKQEELKKVEDEKKKLQEDTAKATKQMAVDIKGLRDELKQLTSL